jgi:hypothetical protein
MLQNHVSKDLPSATYIIPSLLVSVALTLSSLTKRKYAASRNIAQAFSKSRLSSPSGNHEENGFYGKSDRKNPVRSAVDVYQRRREKAPYHGGYHLCLAQQIWPVVRRGY